jgi:hypothetical protein
MDQLGTPVKTGKVTVTVKNPAGATETIELLPEDNEWGLHTGIFVPREGGKYEMEVANESVGRRMKTTIDVSVPTLEKEGLPAKLDVLRELAGLTGGKFQATGDLAQVVQSLSLLPERKPEELRFRLWCDPWWCAALVGLFTAYWVGRKLGGLV